LIGAGVIETDLDSSGSPEKIKILIQVGLDVSTHRDDDDEAGGAQSDGQDHADVASALPKHLTDTYA
jgi:hypothetical protein